MNKVLIIGRLGQDPELKYTAGGKAVCQMSIATSEKRKKDGQMVEKTEWHRVVAWGKTAENCNQYLNKGRQVLIEGKIQTRSFDNQDGKKIYITEIVAQNVQFLFEHVKSQGAVIPDDVLPAESKQQSFMEDQGSQGADMNDIPF